MGSSSCPGGFSTAGCLSRFPGERSESFHDTINRARATFLQNACIPANIDNQICDLSLSDSVMKPAVNNSNFYDAWKNSKLSIEASFCFMARYVDGQPVKLTLNKVQQQKKRLAR